MHILLHLVVPVPQLQNLVLTLTHAQTHRNVLSGLVHRDITVGLLVADLLLDVRIRHASVLDVALRHLLLLDLLNIWHLAQTHLWRPKEGLGALHALLQVWIQGLLLSQRGVEHDVGTVILILANLIRKRLRPTVLREVETLRAQVHLLVLLSVVVLNDLYVLLQARLGLLRGLLEPPLRVERHLPFLLLCIKCIHLDIVLILQLVEEHFVVQEWWLQRPLMRLDLRLLLGGDPVVEDDLLVEGVQSLRVVLLLTLNFIRMNKAIRSLLKVPLLACVFFV